MENTIDRIEYLEERDTEIIMDLDELMHRIEDLEELVEKLTKQHAVIDFQVGGTD